MQQLQVGMQALQSGNLDTAENIFRNILSLDSSEVHSLHFLGVVFCQKGNLDDGIALIEQSIRLDPSRFGPYLNLGRFLVGANQWDRAVAALEQAYIVRVCCICHMAIVCQPHIRCGGRNTRLLA